MKFGKILCCASFLCVGTTVLPAQESNEVQQLKRMMLEMKEDFQRERNEDRQTIRVLTEKVNELIAGKQAQTTNAGPPTATSVSNEAEKKKLEEQLAREL